MIEETRRTIPADHPIRDLFHTLTERGLEQTQVRDQDTIEYVTNLLTDFVHVENMYRAKDSSGHRLQYVFEILQQASETMSPSIRRDYHRHLGDLTLFNLGLFPEHLTYGRRTVSPEFYAERGRRAYNIVAEIDSPASPQVFRKLSDQFERCVVGLHWVKLYINDPFYQYVFREFDVT